MIEGLILSHEETLRMRSEASRRKCGERAGVGVGSLMPRVGVGMVERLEYNTKELRGSLVEWEARRE